MASKCKIDLTHAMQRSHSHAQQIRIAVQDGSVTLEGDVHDWSERAAAEKAVWAISGVTKVDSRIRII